MSKVIVDKKNDKVVLEISIEQAFGILSYLSFSKDIKDYDIYEKMFEKLGKPMFNFNSLLDSNIDEAVKEQKELVKKFKLTTFENIACGQIFLIKDSNNKRRYIKSYYPDDNSNCYFIKHGSLVHAKIEQNTEIEVLGKANFCVTISE